MAEDKKKKDRKVKESLSTLSKEELREKEVALVQSISTLLVRKAAGQLPNTNLVRFARKDLARVKTQLTLKDLK